MAVQLTVTTSRALTFAVAVMDMTSVWRMQLAMVRKYLDHYDQVPKARGE